MCTNLQNISSKDNTFNCVSVGQWLLNQHFGWEFKNVLSSKN